LIRVYVSYEYYPKDKGKSQQLSALGVTTPSLIYRLDFSF